MPWNATSRRAPFYWFLLLLVALPNEVHSKFQLRNNVVYKKWTVQAKLDSDGTLHVVERQEALLNGNPQGYFNFPKKFQLKGIYRIENGKKIALKKGTLTQADHYKTKENRPQTFKWSYKDKSDPDFNGAVIIHQVEYSLPNKLTRIGRRTSFFHLFMALVILKKVEFYSLDVTYPPEFKTEPYHFEQRAKNTKKMKSMISVRQRFPVDATPSSPGTKKGKEIEKYYLKDTGFCSADDFKKFVPDKGKMTREVRIYTTAIAETVCKVTKLKKDFQLEKPSVCLSTETRKYNCIRRVSREIAFQSPVLHTGVVLMMALEAGIILKKSKTKIKTKTKTERNWRYRISTMLDIVDSSISSIHQMAMRRTAASLFTAVEQATNDEVKKLVEMDNKIASRYKKKVLGKIRPMVVKIQKEIDAPGITKKTPGHKHIIWRYKRMKARVKKVSGP